ncbi:MAG TPA: CBS domain-containing protein [Methanothrix sp.]|jgi:CBS domain-containing protein|nr:CBS domain-containing protein [Methanothrix sp.]HOV82481.1 CBS domain-containing protein [Methanothrix sp.]HPC89782.1 CBS domain-containing protein [Methanothrix sp.]HQE88290.1 CBS domain-containing protein [Methanothrix sp.]HQI68743.1 CBS domain-containing protein [Methanothrix sp.]
MQVKDIMTQPVTIDKSERLGHALDLMEKNDLRRLLVTNKDRLGGIITTRQIARVLGTRKSLGMPASSLHVASATMDSIIKVLPDMSVDDAAVLLQKTSVLVVMDGDRILGWVRPREILAAKKVSGQASDAMRSPLTVNPNDRLVHARRMVLDRNVGRLPVVEGGRLVGIISERDIARALRAFRDLNDTASKQYARIYNILVSDVMTHDVKYVYVDTPLEEVKNIILTENRGGLPVLSRREEVVGMITRRSILDYLVKAG